MAQIPLNPIKPLFFMVVSAPTENVICGSIDPAGMAQGIQGARCSWSTRDRSAERPSNSSEDLK